MWWFAAAHANLIDLYRRMVVRAVRGDLAVKPVLDAGCGTGGLLSKLGAAFPGQPVIGLDADAFAAQRARQKSGHPVCVGSVNALPFADDVFAAIFSADVLCHRDVDELTALGEFRRCLGREGALILNLPAYSWLLSRHDAAVYNARRYGARMIRALLRAVGFTPLNISFWNMVLFPVMVITRKVLPAKDASRSDVGLQPPILEWVGRAASATERSLLQRGYRLPFGGSLMVAAVKLGEAANA